MNIVLFILLFIGVTTKTTLAQCKRREVICDGTCVSVHAVCNENIVCAPNEFQCSNRKCILKSWLCDSVDDCDDKSDERKCPPLDLNDVCLSREFTCASGLQCVTKRSQCDGIDDCTDGSDEVGCQPASVVKLSENQALNAGDTLQLICEATGNPVPTISWSLNSGHLPAQCKTSSENGIGRLTCPNIQTEHKGIYSCEAMVKNMSATASAVVYVSSSYISIFQDKYCVLPDYPKNGNYSIPGRIDNLHKPRPGQIYTQSIILNFTCNPGYQLLGSRSLYCVDGEWSGKDPKCVTQCSLKSHSSIIYWCQARGPLLYLEEDQECPEMVPDGTTVRPECRGPNYQYTGGARHSVSSPYYDYGVLTTMRCVAGTWNYVPTCSPKCGLVTAQGDPLVTNGTSAKRGELPWHAAIYKTTTRPYEQICGGSLISNNIVITAAHCFWSDIEKQLPAENYAVALGKLYRPWSNTREVGVQASLIREIKIPSRFRGQATNFQDDIAVVILAIRVKYSEHVLPVCVDFDDKFERRQLVVGHSGKVAGWGLTAEDGRASPVLKVTALPFVDIDRCISESPFSFQSFITSDKFCAGYSNNTGSALCKGDSGGGLVFPSRERSDEVFYLRGVVSTAPRNDHACNTFVYTTFTQISKHRLFIQEHWNEIIIRPY